MKDCFLDVNFGCLVVIVFGIVLFWLCFFDFFVMFNLVIEFYVDGFKVYINIEYYVCYDSFFIYFEGMNYFYGDYVLVVVMQFLVFGFIKVVSDYVVDIIGYIWVIVNFLLLLGILLGVYFFYLFFLWFGMVLWWGVVVSLGIVFLFF